jgi:hypothetical protein
VLSHLVTSLKSPLAQKSGFCTWNHSQRVTSTSSLSWNSWALKCCLSYRVQMFPVKWMQQLLCLMCAVWGCTDMVNDHTLWQTISLGHWSITWEDDNATVMKQWNWLFMNDCQCKSPVSITIKFLNLCRGGTNSSTHLRIVLTTLQLNMRATFNVLMTSYLNSMIQQTLLIEHSL